MKIIFLIIFSIAILIKTPPQLPVCNLFTAKQALPPKIFAQQTIDGPAQPVVITRFFHNKVGIFASEFAYCYLSALDLNFIAGSTSLIGLISFLYFLYQIAIKKIWLAAAIFLFFPLLPFFDFSSLIVSYAYKVFAIIGLLLALYKFRLPAVSRHQS